jgi:uncharacterized membrane protein
MNLFTQTMTIFCIVGAGMAAGTFFTFSTFTMAGLKRLSPARGAAAMQAINKEAPTPLFMLLLFGTGAACVVLMVHAAMNLQEPGYTPPHRWRALHCWRRLHDSRLPCPPQ